MRAVALAALALLLVAAPVPAAASPRDFDAEARLFYRIVACGGDAPVDARIEKVVAAHCKALARQAATFRKRYVDPATAFFAQVRPSGLPATVVYPFGGGDLVSALITYPDATEITTLSLEHAGDPTRLAALTPKQLKKHLAQWRVVVNGLLANSDSESVKLQSLERGPIPGQLSFHILGAALMGYEPVGLRYFRLEPNGTIAYYTADEIDALGKQKKKAKRKKASWKDTDWSVAYTHMELRLRKAGDASAPIVTHRHLAANLEDSAFDGSPIEQHLEAKGKVAAMTKAASYLLWRTNFTAIRDYLAGHLAWMASDTTGLPPRHAAAAGLEQETYGRFAGTIFPTNRVDQAAFVKMYKKQPFRKLGFRYGYRDKSNKPHLLITRPKP